MQKGIDFNVDTVSGKVIFTEKGKAKAERQIKNIKDGTTGKIQSMVQAIQDNGQSKYMLTDDASLVGQDAVGKLVTMGGGQAQPSMILQDYSYAYAASIQCLMPLYTGDVLYQKALESVRKSNTTYGTSRSGLFYGKGQYVGMSGTLSHVNILSDVYGMPVERFGTQKNFELREFNIEETLESFKETINGLKSDLESIEGKGSGLIYEKLVQARQTALNDAIAGLEELNEAMKKAGYTINNNENKAEEVLKILQEGMKSTKAALANTKGGTSKQKLNNKLKAYVSAYEALNIIEIVEFNSQSGYIDSNNGTITEKGIEKIAEDILRDANRGLNQLFVSLNGETLEAVRKKIEQLMAQQGNNQFEIADINGTASANDIYNKNNGKETGYIISGAKARIVLANERGGMGLDYTGNWSVKSDSTNAVYSFMHQTFGRNGRHMNDAESFTRTIYANMDEIDILLNDIKTEEGLFKWLQNKFTGEQNIEFSKYGIFKGIKTVQDIDSLSVAKKIQLAKMYKGLMQSNSSLIFGMIDTLNDVAVTSALADLINMDGISELDKAVIRKIQDSVFNNHTDGDINVSRGELLSGKDQVTNSLEGQKQKAIQIFNQVVNSVKDGSAVQKAAQDWLNSWENATYREQQSANNTNAIVDLEINSGSVQKAFDIIYGRANQIMPYFGPYARSSASDIRTLAQVKEALATENTSGKQLLEVLQAAGSPYVIGDNLTFDGRKLVSNYMLLTGKTKTKQNVYVDDDLAKALMLLLMKALGIEFGVVAVSGASATGAVDNQGNVNNIEAAKLLTANNISLESLMELNGYVSDLGINLTGMSSENLLEILHAQYDINIAKNIKGTLPSAIMIKLIELNGTENSEATAESIKKIMTSASDKFSADLAKQYNLFKTIEQQTKEAVYKQRLTAKEIVATGINKFKNKYPMIAEMLGNTGRFIKGTLGYMLFRAPAVTTLGNAFGATSGMQKTWQVQSFSNALAQAFAFMTVNVIGDLAKFFGAKLPGMKNKEADTQLGLIGNVAAVSMSVWNLGSQVVKGILRTNNAKKLDKLMNPNISEITNGNEKEIKVRIEMAGMKLTEEIETAISNLRWMENNMPALFAKIKLADLNGLEKINGLIEIAKADENFGIGLDYDSLKEIISGNRTVIEMLAPDFSDKLGFKDIGNIEKISDKYDAIVENNNILKNTTVYKLNGIIEELGLDTEYAMALLYPTKNPADMAARYNSVLKTPAYAKTIKIIDIRNDNNFVVSGDKEELSGALKKKAALSVSYGETPNKDRGPIAVSNANRILKISGGQETEKFVNQLDIGVLADKEFAAGLISIISKKHKDNTITAAKDLAEKINAIYEDDAKNVADKISETVTLFESITEERIDVVQTSDSGKVSEVISKCMKASIDTVGKIIPLEPLTRKAVEMNPYAQDELLVAGLNETLDKATTMGTIREKTGFEYRTVTSDEFSSLDTPFIVYIGSKEPYKAGHVITITNVNNGILTFTDDNVTDGLMSIEALYESGFEGLVLASSKSKVGTKVASVSDIAEKTIGKETYESLSADAKKLVTEIITGVTKPKDINTTLSALLAVCKDADAIAAMLGFASMSEVKDKGLKEINSKYSQQISRVLAFEGASGADKQVSVALLAMAKDVMIMAVKNPQTITMLDSSSLTADEIMPILVISKAVNQNVAFAADNSIVNGDTEDFVIDIVKLQSLVKTKINITNAKKELEDLASMLSSGGRGSASMPFSLMKLSDIKAVSQAA
ncbi:MAG: hypothetical protein PHN29_06130 [Endomicrobiaceae bacterium]|nr:hypothetical protein [Endomicrobiaceae bacterium]